MSLEKPSEKSSSTADASSAPKLKGRNVSGRSWKVRPQKRASSLKHTKKNNTTKSWNDKVQEKRNLKEVKELAEQLKEERIQEKRQTRERRLENERRRMENEFRTASKSAQSLNLAKASLTLKAMSKKQLRQVKKTRMNSKTGVVEYVPAYSK